MYSLNQSFWKLVAQGVAEANLAGVFLAKSLTYAEGYILFFSSLSIALICHIISQHFLLCRQPYTYCSLCSCR